MRTFAVCGALVVLIAGCASVSKPDTAVLGQQILAAEATEAAGWAARDVDQIMSVYASDAIVLLGGAPAPDREELRALFAGFLKDPGFTLTFRSDPPHVSAAGDIGIAVGTYQLTYTDPRTGELGRKTGRHLMNWKRQPDGRWLVIRQMTTHDAR